MKTSQHFRTHDVHVVAPGNLSNSLHTYPLVTQEDPFSSIGVMIVLIIPQMAYLKAASDIGNSLPNFPINPENQSSFSFFKKVPTWQDLMKSYSFSWPAVSKSSCFKPCDENPLLHAIFQPCLFSYICEKSPFLFHPKKSKFYLFIYCLHQHIMHHLCSALAHDHLRL